MVFNHFLAPFNNCLDCVAGKFAIAGASQCTGLCVACMFGAPWCGVQPFSCTSVIRVFKNHGSACLDCVAGKFAIAGARQCTGLCVFGAPWCGVQPFSCTSVIRVFKNHESACLDCTAGKFLETSGATSSTQCAGLCVACIIDMALRDFRPFSCTRDIIQES